MPETMLLRDQDVVPTKDVLKEVLGNSLYTTYEELDKTITSDDFGLNSSWNYYKDGKAWLCKVVSGKKTIFWLSAWDGFIKTGFYFTEKTRIGVLDLPINSKLKHDFEKVGNTGKLFPLILDIDSREQLKDLKEIIRYKKSLK